MFQGMLLSSPHPPLFQTCLPMDRWTKMDWASQFMLGHVKHHAMEDSPQTDYPWNNLHLRKCFALLFFAACTRHA